MRYWDGFIDLSWVVNDYVKVKDVENTKSQNGLTWNTLIPLQTSEYKMINYQLYILRKGNTLEDS